MSGVILDKKDINALGNAFKTIETIFNRYGLTGGDSEQKATKSTEATRVKKYKKLIEEKHGNNR